VKLPIGRSRKDLMCQQVVEMVTDYLEEALTTADRQRLDQHLAGCEDCTEYLAQVRETISLAGRLTPADLTPQMRDTFTDIFHRWQAGA
jgi:predicted anti-sigma-YlaC factor YlaD